MQVMGAIGVIVISANLRPAWLLGGITARQKASCLALLLRCFRKLRTRHMAFPLACPHV
jgi:hypothetical protein